MPAKKKIETTKPSRSDAPTCSSSDRIMKNEFCKLTEDELYTMTIPDIATGLLTSPFQFNRVGSWVTVPVETFQQFTDVVTAYVVESNSRMNVRVLLRA
jgi:hypothetical protein